MPRSSKVLNIRGFGLGGLNTDLAPWDVPENTITRGNNFRIVNGKLQSYGSFGNSDIVPYGMDHFFYVPADNPTWVFCGQESVGNPKIIAFIGGNEVNLHDYLPTDTIDRLGWQHTFLGRVPIVNNPGDYPMFWETQDAATNFEYLPWDR